MKALVVYESMYGNTAAIGEAIATSLRTQGFWVDAGPVSKVVPAAATGVDLLVLGGPTHAHGVSRASTRKVAVSDTKNTFAGRTLAPGLREWIEQLPPGADHPAAAFDTRIDRSIHITGSAAKGIARRLRRRGYHVVAPPECFLVTTKNELVDRETEHAATWAAGLAGRVLEGTGAAG